MYVEPFAGGAGAALRLLYDEYIDQIVINDLNSGIAAFWRSVFHRTEELAAAIESADVTIDAWHHHRAIHESRDSQPDDLALGFATFFVNRTNRSGILGARPIGGMQQSGKWKIHARYNRTTLAQRVRTLGHYRNRVTVTQKDGVDVVERLAEQRTMIYADPPYLGNGSDLYLDAMSWSDHQRLAGILCRRRTPWLVTYDCDPRVMSLYPRQRHASFSIAHTAAQPHVGREFVVFSDFLRLDVLAAFDTRRAFVWLGASPDAFSSIVRQNPR